MSNATVTDESVHLSARNIIPARRGLGCQFADGVSDRVAGLAIYAAPSDRKGIHPFIHP